MGLQVLFLILFFSVFAICSALLSKSTRSGLHGQNFKFLPIIQGNPKKHFPRIVCIAGVYPDLSPEELMAPSSSPAAPVGRWMYDFSDPDGPQLGTVAIPGSDVVTECIDPIAVIAKNTVLGVDAPEDMEMVVLIDRANRNFSPDNFYIFKTPSNTLLIQWTESISQGYQCLGKVVLCLSPFLESMRTALSGFAEADEDDFE
jgi:hypothetical protein